MRQWYHNLTPFNQWLVRIMVVTLIVAVPGYALGIGLLLTGEPAPEAPVSGGPAANARATRTPQAGVVATPPQNPSATPRPLPTATVTVRPPSATPSQVRTPTSLPRLTATPTPRQTALPQLPGLPTVTPVPPVRQATESAPPASPSPTPTRQQRFNNLRALVQTDISRGPEGKEEREVLKRLDEIEKDLDRGEAQNGRKKLGELMKKVEEFARDEKLDPQIARHLINHLGDLAGQLG